MKKILVQVFDFFSSIKLAVILIFTLAVILAVGTFYEAAHGTEDAQRVIYKSWFVSVEMFFLILNLSCAAIDRLPWKKNHVGFVITHAGIIILLLGSFITQKQGIDGNMVLAQNEASDSFFVQDRELQIYQSLEGKPFFLLYQASVDFDNSPPSPGSSKYRYHLADDDELQVVNYKQRTLRKIDVKEDREASSKDPLRLAIHFDLHNDRVSVSEWLSLDRSIPSFYDLGPAVVTLIGGPLPTPPQPRNQIVVYQPNVQKADLKFAIFSMRQKKPVLEGVLETGKFYETGWMGLKFSVDKIYAHSAPVITYSDADPEKDSENAPPAIEIQVGSHSKWLEMDVPVEIKGNKSSYYVRLTRKQFPLGFQIALKKFKMGLYGGSQLPMSYESTVLVNNQREQVISMNEPLYFKNYTLYQSSYETNDRGEPVASIFSVNYDPGRAMKYFGAICICAGIAIMFYWKPRWTRKKRATA